MIAFYLENSTIPDVDFRNMEGGNPGCGGTEYLFVALPYYLLKYYGEIYELVIFANVVDHLPKHIKTLQVSNIYEALKKAKEVGCDLFVYRPKWKEKEDVLNLITDLKIPTIGWAHITPTAPVLRSIARNIFFKALVCVEHEQYDFIQDSPVCQKLTYIVNGFDVDGFRLPSPPKKDPKQVVYIGALTIQKGFHLLAKAWPKVLEQVPDAKLTVIGTGKLYNKFAELGRLGIAEKDYEDKHIIPFLCDEQLNVHPSVRFAGKLGHEKKELLHRALIGVANPSGETENCPGSALEIQACSTPVVSVARFGMLDTVSHGITGLLHNSHKELASSLIYLLRNTDRAYDLGKNGPQFIRERYNWNRITTMWIKLFEDLYGDKNIDRIPFKKNLLKHYKFLKMINLPLQQLLGSFIFWPSVSELQEKISRVYFKLRLIFGRK
jgi:glycosyltransferase involved in cell wall biosynthesis